MIPINDNVSTNRFPFVTVGGFIFGLLKIRPLATNRKQVPAY